MSEVWLAIEALLIKYSLVTAFAVVGLITGLSYAISKYITRGRMHGSAIAILLGLVLAYVGGSWQSSPLLSACDWKSSWRQA